MAVKCSLAAACILIAVSCAKHKLTPIGTPVSPQAGAAQPRGSTPPPLLQGPVAPITNAAKPAVQAKAAGPDVNRMILEPPRMSFSANLRTSKQAPVGVDKMTVLVVTENGALRPDSKDAIQSALQAASGEMMFACPSRMRVGSGEDCRFAAKSELNNVFKDALLKQGVPAAQAESVTVLVQADLTASERSAFDIHGIPANASANARLWRVVPLNPGDYNLELKATFRARVPGAADVAGSPVVLEHSVSVIGGETFLNQYWPAMLGTLAAVAMFLWIAYTYWFGPRASALGNR